MSRMPYYPQMNVTLRETPFGIQEMTPKTLYETHIDGHVLYRFDLLEALREVIGDEAMIARNYLYEVISATDSEAESYKKLAILYHAFPKVTRVINEISVYGNTQAPLASLVIDDWNSRIADYKNSLMNKYNVTKVKFLVESYDYLYFSTQFDMSTTERGVYKC